MATEVNLVRKVGNQFLALLNTQKDEKLLRMLSEYFRGDLYQQVTTDIRDLATFGLHLSEDNPDLGVRLYELLVFIIPQDRSLSKGATALAATVPGAIAMEGDGIDYTLKGVKGELYDLLLNLTLGMEQHKVMLTRAEVPKLVAADLAKMHPHYQSDQVGLEIKYCSTKSLSISPSLSLTTRQIR